jgi:hypothetical protein
MIIAQARRCGSHTGPEASNHPRNKTADPSAYGGPHRAHEGFGDRLQPAEGRTAKSGCATIPRIRSGTARHESVWRTRKSYVTVTETQGARRVWGPTAASRRTHSQEWLCHYTAHQERHSQARISVGEPENPTQRPQRHRAHEAFGDRL